MIRGYEAILSEEWLPLSEQHRKHLGHLEEILSSYLEGNKDVPCVAVVGPYGQGKTQLLFLSFFAMLFFGQFEDLVGVGHHF